MLCTSVFDSDWLAILVEALLIIRNVLSLSFSSPSWDGAVGQQGKYDLIEQVDIKISGGGAKSKL